MDKKIIENYIKNSYTIRQIAKESKLSYTTVRHWLKKYGLKTIGKAKHKEYNCLRCGQTDSEEFYGKQKQTCKRCRDLDALVKQKEKRKYAIDLLGNKCNVCGYHKCINAFDIHHVDPSKKDDNFNHMRSWSFDRIKKELKNCVLLCSNCHRETHSK
jgi:hypothetical protein